MISKIVRSSFAIVAFLAAGAVSAAAEAPVVYSWTGLYVGLNAGVMWSPNNVNTTTANLFGNPGLGNGVVYGIGSAALATFSKRVNDIGFVGGGQIGYNWKFANSWVAGPEADIQGVAGGNRSANVSSTAKVAGGATEFLTQTATVTKRLDYFGTARGRLGFLVTPSLLAYGTGGLAFGGVRASTSITQMITNAPGVPNAYSSFGSLSRTRVGWTVGVGGEWMVSSTWSAKAEYLYYDLGRATYSSSTLNNFNAGGVLFTSGAPTSSTRFNGHIVRAGVNYHFNW